MYSLLYMNKENDLIFLFFYYVEEVRIIWLKSLFCIFLNDIFMLIRIFNFGKSYG